MPLFPCENNNISTIDLKCLFIFRSVILGSVDSASIEVRKVAVVRSSNCRLSNYLNNTNLKKIVERITLFMLSLRDE